VLKAKNRKAVQASAVDASISKVTSVRQSMYESAEITGIYTAGLANPDDLDELSRTRFRLLLRNVLMAVSNIYSQTHFAGLSSSMWESQLVLLRGVVTSPGGQLFWKEYQLEFDEAFRRQIEAILQDT
jgi:hypothetical protein